MVKKKIGVGIIFALALLLSVLLAYAATTVTITHPTSAGVYTGDVFFIVSGTNDSGGGVANATMNVTCSDGTNQVFNNLTSANGSANILALNFSTTKCPDGATTINATMVNGTNIQSAATGSFTIDNTAPTATLDVRPPLVNKGKPVTLDGSRSTDGTTPLTYAFVIVKPFNGGNTSIKTARENTFFGADVNVKGTYTGALMVTDQANLSTYTSVNFRVVEDDEDIPLNLPPATSTAVGVQQSAIGAGGLPPVFWYAIGFLALSIMAVLLIILITKTKK